ncbi:hypothetical protein F5883DRAFT_683073 [Diaporthe sp. PMI_573]|nr:hypothetical protein F5883DRAFT_683073 [Diaporthaceae sp. PMI_573]
MLAGLKRRLGDHKCYQASLVSDLSRDLKTHLQFPQTEPIVVELVSSAEQHPVHGGDLNKILAFLIFEYMLGRKPDTFKSLIKVAVLNFCKLPVSSQEILTSGSDKYFAGGADDILNVLFATALSHDLPDCEQALEQLVQNLPAWKPTESHFRLAAKRNSVRSFNALNEHNRRLEKEELSWTDSVLIAAVENPSPARLDITRAILKAKNHDDSFGLDDAIRIAKQSGDKPYSVELVEELERGWTVLLII